MRTKLFLSFVLVLAILAPAARAQEPEKKPYHLYLPVVSKMYRQTCSSGAWRLIEPEHAINLVLNPSAEAAGNFAAAGGGAVNRVTTASLYGLRSFEVVTAANGDGISLTTATLASAAHYATLRVHGTLPPAWRVGIAGNLKAPRLIERVSQDWSLYGVAFSAGEAGGAAALTITQSGAGASTFNVDGIQLEQSGHWSSYVDGSQSDCRWLGTPNAATSERGAAARTGGRPRDFQRDYGLLITEMIGGGVPPVSLDVRGYATLPGGELAGSKLESREFSLIGTLSARSKPELHAKRQRLTEVLLGAGGQPIRLEYKGALPVKSIDCLYAGGLEGQLPVTYGNLEAIDEGWQNTKTYEEKIALQFVAPTPQFFAIGESAVVLDTNDTATLRYVAGRLRSLGQWSNLGLGANPTANGTVYAIAYNPVNFKVYVGGDWTGLAGVAGRDYIAAYDLLTGTWETVGPGASVNGMIRAIAIAPNGDVYCGGSFLNLGGANGDYLAYYDISAGAWAPVAAGGSGTVLSIAFGADGRLFFGGSFVNWAAIGAADYICQFTGGAYAALAASGMDNDVDDLAINPATGHLFAAGNFTTAAGVASRGAAEWDGSAWIAINPGGLGGGGGASTSTVTITSDGRAFYGGNFTSINGVTASNVAVWNGTSWQPLGNGTNGTVLRMRKAPDDTLILSGTFTTAGGISFADRVCGWNGTTFFPLDVDLPGAPVVWALELGNPDPTNSSLYDTWLGFDTTGASSFSGVATVNNNASSPVYPQIIISRSAGTSARLESIRNETTGKRLLCNYALIPDEVLTINLAPTQKSITSSFFGLRQDAILSNSDFGSWRLELGDNLVSVFVSEVGAPTITAYMLWRPPYNGAD